MDGNHTCIKGLKEELAWATIKWVYIISTTCYLKQL